MRTEKRSEVHFNLHLKKKKKKEIKTYHYPSDLIFEWLLPLNHLYIITFKKLKNTQLLLLRICDVLMGI